jgi:hypothetical protein
MAAEAFRATRVTKPIERDAIVSHTTITRWCCGMWPNTSADGLVLLARLVRHGEWMKRQCLSVGKAALVEANVE